MFEQSLELAILSFDQADQSFDFIEVIRTRALSKIFGVL